MDGNLIKIARTSIVRVDIAFPIHTAALHALLVSVLDRADFLFDVLLDLNAISWSNLTVVTADGV